MVISDSRKHVFQTAIVILKHFNGKYVCIFKLKKPQPTQKNKEKPKTHKKVLKIKTTEDFTNKVADFLIYMPKDSGEDVISATSF